MTERDAAVSALVAAARRVSAATSGKGVREGFPKDTRQELARLEGALARLKAEGGYPSEQQSQGGN